MAKQLKLLATAAILAASSWAAPEPGPAMECGSGTFNAEAILSGGTWTVRNGGATVYTGPDMLEAMRRAVASLSPGRTAKQSVVVRGSGSMPANASLDIPSQTILDVCGTINVTGSPSGENAVVRGRNARGIEIRHLTITGSPAYGLHFRGGGDLHFGKLDFRVTGGMGIRIDNDPPNNSWGMTNQVTKVRIDTLFVSGTSSHGVETYGVDGITIGSLTTRKTGECGILLNATMNANIGSVDAEDAGAGTGYAAFRLANRAGRIGSNAWPTNIRVGSIKARGGGRGIFCVSESGGATIDRVDIAATGNNSILLENCHNMNIAAVGGTVTGRDIRIASRTEFAVSSDITFQNLRVINATVVESPCAPRSKVINLSLENSTQNVCSGTTVGIQEAAGAVSPGLDGITTQILGSSLILEFHPESAGRWLQGRSVLQLATAQGRLLHSQILPGAGGLKRRIDMQSAGTYVLRLANGRDRISRPVIAR